MKKAALGRLFLPAQLAEGCQVWLFFSQFLPAEKLDEQPEKQVCSKGCCDGFKKAHDSHLLSGQEPMKSIAKFSRICYNLNRIQETMAWHSVLLNTRREPDTGAACCGRPLFVFDNGHTLLVCSFLLLFS